MQMHSRSAVLVPHSKRQTLEGKTILVTRRTEQADDFIAEIESRGGRAVVIPLIQISDPESWLPCDAALANLSSYSAIIFTSRNGVERFFQRLQERGIKMPGHINIYAVGERTCEAIKEKGAVVTFVPSNFSSAALIDFLNQEMVEDKTFLLPGGNLNASDISTALTQRGAKVTSVEVYRNTEPDEVMADDLKKRFSAGEFDVVTFTSSSAVKNFAHIVSPVRVTEKTKIAVIGPSTRETAYTLKFPIDIEAKQSTAVGLVDAIAEFYSNTKTGSDL